MNVPGDNQLRAFDIFLSDNDVSKEFGNTHNTHYFELNIVISALSHARWGAEAGNGYYARTRETRAHAHPFASLALGFVNTIGVMLT